MEKCDTLIKYGSSFQSKVISVLLHDKIFLERVYDIVNKDFFETSAHQWIIETILSYYTTHKCAPTADVFKVKLNEISDNNDGLNVLKDTIKREIVLASNKKNDSDIKFISEEFLTFCKNQKVKQAILDSVDLIKAGEYDRIKLKFDEALKAGAERNVGHNYKVDISSRMENIIRNCIKTNWKEFDKLIDGGLGAGELGVLIAPAGSGKSWFLSRIGTEALKQNKNVLHVTLELNELYVGRRYDSCITGIDFQDIAKKEHYNFVKEKVEQVPGNLYIKYFPTKSVSANSLKVHLERTQNVTNEKIDLLIVDYADILRPFATERGSNSYSSAGNIYEELRGVAGELQIPTWSVSQCNRSASNLDIILADSVADSYAKIMISDVIMSLSRKTSDKLNGTARFHFIKNRFGADGMTFNAKMNTSNGIIEMHLNDSTEGMEIGKSFINEEESEKKYLKSKLKQWKSSKV